MGVSRFFNGAVDVHRICIVEVISSLSNALMLESHALVEVLGCTERGGTASDANPDTSSRSPDHLKGSGERAGVSGWLNGMPTEEATFTKEQNGYDRLS